MISSLVRHRLSQYPAVAILGPRQAGKTTLAKSLGGLYFDLEQEGDRTRLDLQWDNLCSGSERLILDEAQSWPEAFGRLRGAIDADRQRLGRFLVLGSVSPSLTRQVSESLAGRLSPVELTPVLGLEVPHRDLNELWLRGGYPEGGILDLSRFPQWQNDYLSLLSQRDLPAWGLPAKPHLTERFLRMTAAVNGQLWNASQIGQALGLSHPTVNSYLAYLEGAFLIRRLAPYASNLRKRLVKSPKIYWRDAGLLHALLRVGHLDDLLARPWAGASWEGFVIEQILGALSQRGIGLDPYFFRTSDGYEADLVLDYGAERWVVEIKLTSQPSPQDLSALRKTSDLLHASRRVLLSQTSQAVFQDSEISCNLRDFLNYLAAQFPLHAS